MLNEMLKKVNSYYEIKGEEYQVITAIDDSVYILKRDTQDPLSVTVKDIAFDEEKQLFLMHDTITLDSDTSANLYFYIGLDMMPIGFVYCDLMDGYYSLTVPKEEDPYLCGKKMEDMYEIFKNNLRDLLLKQLKDKRNHFETIINNILNLTYKK